MAPVTLVRFKSDGEFSMMSCYVIEQANNLTISEGDGQAIFLGSWLRVASAIEAKFQLTYETVGPVGGSKYPGPVQRVSGRMTGRSLTFGGRQYEAAQHLDALDYEQFIAPERKRTSTREQ